MANLLEDNSIFSCGHCQIRLGTLIHIVEKGIAESHDCFESSENISINYESKEMVRDVNIQKLPSEVISQPVPQTSGNSSKGDKIKLHNDREGMNNIWKENEVALLIATYKTHMNKFNNGSYTKKRIWVMISNEMKIHGVDKDHIKCDEKWRNSRKAYDKVKMELEKSGNGNVTWKYFKDFQEIYHKDPRFTPICTVSSSGISKRASSSDDIVAKKCSKFSPDEEKRPKSLTLKDLDDRIQKRHEEKMELKNRVFQWFKDNFKKYGN